MLIIHNPEEWETVSEHKICSYHKKYPGANWPGCTCSSSITQQRKELVDSVDRARKQMQEGIEYCSYEDVFNKDE